MAYFIALKLRTRPCVWSPVGISGAWRRCSCVLAKSVRMLRLTPLDPWTSTSGGFLKWGYPQSSSICRWDLPWKTPSIYWDSPMETSILAETADLWSSTKSSWSSNSYGSYGQKHAVWPKNILALRLLLAILLPLWRQEFCIWRISPQKVQWQLPVAHIPLTPFAGKWL